MSSAFFRTLPLLVLCTLCCAESNPQIRLRVERLESGDWKPVNAATVFEQGQYVRFLVSANFGGYLYVMNRGTSGSYELLFPRAETGSDNHIAASKEYRVPSVEGGFRISGPAGQDVVYWVISPVELGPVYRPLPPPPAPGAVPSSLKPRCDDTLFKARGECVDNSAGVKPVKSADTLPSNLKGVAAATPREVIFIQDRNSAQESVVISSPAPFTGPVVYELRLAHR